MIERRAHAKINLHLHSVRRRADGYHELRTLFCHLDLHDQIRLKPTEGIVTIDSPMGLAVEDDLAGRAALALRKQLRRPELGCHIEIDKRLPAGGGLGGGSADAAAVLMALGELWGVDQATLHRIATGLGADVPFLLRGGLQLAGGIGEDLEAVEHAMPPTPLLLLFPGVPVSTPEAFRWLDEDGLDTDSNGEEQLQRLLTALRQGASVIKHLYNGFDLPVRRRVAAVEAAMGAAERAGFQALLCGSGSTVAAFGPGDTDHPDLAPFRPIPALLAGLDGPIEP